MMMATVMPSPKSPNSPNPAEALLSDAVAVPVPKEGIFDKCLRRLKSFVFHGPSTESGKEDKGAVHAAHALSAVDDDATAAGAADKKDVDVQDKDEARYAFHAYKERDAFTTPPKRSPRSPRSPLSPRSLPSPPPVRRINAFHSNTMDISPAISPVAISPASRLALEHIAASVGCDPAALRHQD